jgi:hypothetical protein
MDIRIRKNHSDWIKVHEYSHDINKKKKTNSMACPTDLCFGMSLPWYLLYYTPDENGIVVGKM